MDAHLDAYALIRLKNFMCYDLVVGEMKNEIQKSSVTAFVFTLLLVFTACKSGTSVADLAKIEYQQESFIEINGNDPQFSNDEITTESFERYSDLDALGRCGTAIACIGKDIMPTEERGAIGQVKPSGWQLVKYDIVDGKYLYNRCHLIGYQLSGENANEKNLITGTRSMNVDGMLPFENMVADYVENTNKHIMYRVTPVYDGEDLVAKGVQMEAYSVEDKGESISFNVFVFKSQPGVKINYKDGTSQLLKDNTFESDDNNKEKSEVNVNEQKEYILNTNTKKIHRKDCSSVRDVQGQNIEIYNGTKEYLDDNGYTECGKCKP